MKKSIENTKEVLHFVKYAEEYCNFLEVKEKISNDEFLNKAIYILSGMYHAACSLPNVPALDVEEFSIRSDLKIAKITAQIYERFKKYDVYYPSYDPYEPDNPEIIGGTLIDDFGDIYHDIKEYLIVYHSCIKNAKIEAIWQWRFQFTYHWGVHLLSLLRVLHWLKYQYLV